jgi:hypothetical protein
MHPFDSLFRKGDEEAGMQNFSSDKDNDEDSGVPGP